MILANGFKKKVFNISSENILRSNMVELYSIIQKFKYALLIWSWLKILPWLVSGQLQHLNNQGYSILFERGGIFKNLLHFDLKQQSYCLVRTYQKCTRFMPVPLGFENLHLFSSAVEKISNIYK